MKFDFPICRVCASSALAFLISCQSSPLTKLDNRQIRQISISKGQAKVVTIDARNEIDFVLSRLSHLRSNADIKVRPEFQVTFYPVGGDAFMLRLGRDCIGPDIPASQYAKRWYFQNSELYDFICAKYSGSKQ